MALVMVQRTKQATMPLFGVSSGTGTRRGSKKGGGGRHTGDGRQEERATTKSVNRQGCGDGD